MNIVVSKDGNGSLGRRDNDGSDQGRRAHGAEYANCMFWMSRISRIS